ncbi:hypothetical protein [Microbacterium gorillae]|uniref:hypothetical protein n=1 Tax=Microbacterium gorillae TaxID=1231063 RepID=UPI003D99C3EE
MTDTSSGSLSFRTVFGGPRIPGAFVEELKGMQHELRALSWDYTYDIFVTVGGDLTVVDEPTRLVRPRISVTKHLATGEIRINSTDVMAFPDPRTVLRPALHNGMSELIDRAAARDGSFDPSGDRNRLATIEN